MQAFNHYLYLLINADPNTAVWLLSTGQFIAKKVIYIIPLTLACVWLWGSHEQRQAAIKALLLTALALALNQIIGTLYPTLRPFELGLGYNFLVHAPTASFPSNHLTIFMCVGLSFAFSGTPIIGILLLTLGLVVAWARIFVGVHFPLDMIGAVIVSCFLYIAFSPVWRRISAPITTFLESIYRSIFAVFIRLGLIRR